MPGHIVRAVLQVKVVIDEDDIQQLLDATLPDEPDFTFEQAAQKIALELIGEGHYNLKGVSFLPA